MDKLANMNPSFATDRISHPFPRAKRTKSAKRLLSAIIGITLVTLFLVIGLLMAVNAFFEGHEFAFHQIVKVQFHMPITIEQRKFPAPSFNVKQATDSGKVSYHIIPTVEAATPASPVPAYDVDVDHLVSFVHWRETSNGTAPQGHHIYCRNKGLTNEYGYDPADKFCFANQDVAYNTVYDWFKRSLAVRDVPASLCRYNIGAAVENCGYYQDYLAYK